MKLTKSNNRAFMEAEINVDAQTIPLNAIFVPMNSNADISVNFLDIIMKLGKCNNCAIMKA